MTANASRQKSDCYVHLIWFAGNSELAADESLTLGYAGALISPITVVLNLVTLIAILRYRTLQYISLISLGNLCLCSLLTGLIAQPLYSAVLLRGASEVDCNTILAFEMAAEILMTCSFLTLCFVGFERFIAIFHPFKQENILTKTKTILVILTVWFTSLFLSISIIISSRVKDTVHFIDLIMTLLGSLWMVFVYLRVLLLVRSIKRRVEDSQRRFSKSVVHHRIKHDGKRTWLTVVVIVVIVVYHTTYDSIRMIIELDQRGRISPAQLQSYKEVLAWGWIIYLSVSTMTPVTLWLSNSQIRWCLKRMYAYFLCMEGEANISYEMGDSKLSKLLAPFLISQRLRMASEMRRQREKLAVIYKTS